MRIQQPRFHNINNEINGNTGGVGGGVYFYEYTNFTMNSAVFQTDAVFQIAAVHRKGPLHPDGAAVCTGRSAVRL